MPDVLERKSIQYTISKPSKDNTRSSTPLLERADFRNPRPKRRRAAEVLSFTEVPNVNYELRRPVYFRTWKAESQFVVEWDAIPLRMSHSRKKTALENLWKAITKLYEDLSQPHVEITRDQSDTFEILRQFFSQQSDPDDESWLLASIESLQDEGN